MKPKYEIKEFTTLENCNKFIKKSSRKIESINFSTTSLKLGVVKYHLLVKYKKRN